MRLRRLVLGCLSVALAAPASAQIIATSIPREDTGGGTGSNAERRFALHLMASPLTKWRINEILFGQANFDVRTFTDFGILTGTPNSDFLLAGEMAFKAGDNWTIGAGGWYNKVGKVQYDFDVATLITLGPCCDELLDTDNLTGTLDGDLNLAEGHVNVFYKSFGIQTGLVHVSSEISNSRIATSSDPTNIGRRLGSVEGQTNSVTDWDLYGVYKTGGGDTRPWALSLGAGIYRKKGSTESAQRLGESQTVPSGFVTASVGLFKGLGVDASFWYIGKTEAARGSDALVTSDAASRFTLGIGYTFSR
jgi:hypothetical protein